MAPLDLHLEHHGVCTPSIGLGEEVLCAPSPIPATPEGDGKDTRPACRIEVASVGSPGICEIQGSTQVRQAGYPFGRSQDLGIVVVAGTVVGGSAGALVELPPASVFALNCARENKAQNQSKRYQTNQSSTHDDLLYQILIMSPIHITKVYLSISTL